MQKRLIIFVLVASLAMLSFGCVTTVSRIQEDPQKYSDKTVSFKGEVMNVINIPLVDASVFLFGNEEDKVPAVSSMRHTKGEKYIMKGKVIAFPEDDSKEASEAVVTAIEEFLVEHDLVKKDKARRVGEAVLSGLYKVSEDLGRVFFVLEEDALIR